MRNPVRSTRIRGWLAIVIAWAGVAHLLAAGVSHKNWARPSETSELLPGIDYVQGEVLITFRPADMPTRDEVTTAPARVSIEPLDEFFESVGAANLRKLFPWDESYESEAGQRLARTFVLRYDAPVDAQEMVDQISELP